MKSKQNALRFRKGLQTTVAALAVATLIGFGSSAAAYATEAPVDPDVTAVEATASAEATQDAEAETQRKADEVAAQAVADAQREAEELAEQQALEAQANQPAEEVVAEETVIEVVTESEASTDDAVDEGAKEEEAASDDVTPVVTTPAVVDTTTNTDDAADDVDAVEPEKATTDDTTDAAEGAKDGETTDSNTEAETDTKTTTPEGTVDDKKAATPSAEATPAEGTPSAASAADEPTTVRPYVPMRGGNFVTIFDQTCVVYTDQAGNVVTGTVAIPRTHLTITASPADDSCVFPATAETVWVFKYETPIPPEGALIQLVCDPVPSAVINTYVTPYDIEWGPVLNVIYVNFEEVHRGYADDDGHFQYTLPLVPNQENFISTGYNIGGGDGLGYGPSVTFKPNPCDTDTPVTIVTPKAPTQVGNTVTIPTDKCVVYKDEQGNVLTGTVAVPKGGLIVTASLASDECEFAAGNIRLKWPFEYKAPVDPTPEPLPVVTPESPISVDGKVTIPVTECVVYKDAAGKVLSGTISIPKGGLAITASPVEGKCQFPKDAVTKWNFEYVPPFTPTPKPTEPPVTPTPVAPKPTEAPVVPVPVPTETFKPSSTVSNGSTNKGDAKVKNDELAITGSESETSLLVAIGALALVASGFILMRRRRTQA